MDIQGQGADVGQTGPVHLRAGHRGILQGLHGRQDAFPDVLVAVAHLGLGAGQGPGQDRAVPEISHPIHARIVHVAHLPRGVNAHPKHPSVGVVGTGRAVRLHRLCADLPGDIHGGPEVFGHGQQRLRLVPGQELYRGAVGLEGRVHDPLLPFQVEGTGVVLRQIVVGARCLGRGRKGLVLGGDRSGGPQPPQAQQQWQRQHPPGGRPSFHRDTAWHKRHGAFLMTGHGAYRRGDPFPGQSATSFIAGDALDTISEWLPTRSRQGGS